MSKKKGKKTSILRIQLSVVVNHDEEDDIEELIKTSDFDATHKDASFIAVRPLNYQVVNNKFK